MGVDAAFSCNVSDEWRVVGATILQHLNEPYTAELELRSDRPGAAPAELLGEKVTLTYWREGHLPSAVHGIVTRVREGQHLNETHTSASIAVEPALASLKQTRASRIFQEKTALEVLQIVLGEKLGAYGRSLSVQCEAPYALRDYAVQYRESDFDFVHRLMEEEGIVYYFDQPAGDGVGQEVMVLVDRPAHHPEAPAPMGVPFSQVQETGAFDRERMREFGSSSRLRPTGVRTHHFNWTNPPATVSEQRLEEGGSGNGALIGPARTVYEHAERMVLHAYSGVYADNNAAHQVQVRREEQRRDARLTAGISNVVGMAAGYKFTLTEHPQGELNGDYVVVSAAHFLLRASGGIDGGYYNQLTCIPFDTPWRPSRVRYQPRIAGAQTAIVVGPPGEEIHTDEHGRVKVRFHWETPIETPDERASCWIRVMQSWAGPGFGSYTIPRIGMEVVVTFLEGDPDYPLVIGCVYNGQNPPPLNLPAEKSRTILQSRSTPGGGGQNMIRMEDTAGQEELYIHAQYDMNTEVLNNQTTTVHETCIINCGAGSETQIKMEKNGTLTLTGASGAGTITITPDGKITLIGTEIHLNP